jgi:hypothetical protein
MTNRIPGCRSSKNLPSRPWVCSRVSISEIVSDLLSNRHNNLVSVPSTDKAAPSLCLCLR